MEPEGSLLHSQGPTALPILSQIPLPEDQAVKWMPNYTHLKNMHKHNNVVDVLSDYPVHWLLNDTHQLYAHSPLRKCTCYQKTLAWITYYTYHKQMGTNYYEFNVLPECSIDSMPHYTLPKYKGTR
jgi:hypothetical protein